MAPRRDQGGGREGTPTADPTDLIRPRRQISGMAAVLLPYDDWHRPDWDSFDRLLAETAASGLTPAVNMDTGYAALLMPTEREWVLDRVRVVLAGQPFVAGAFHRDTPAKAYDAEAHARAIEQVVAYGGTPIVFPSFGMQKLAEDEVVPAFARFGEVCDRFLAFELGEQFAPFGRIFTLDTYRGLLGLPQCVGAKHSSLDREQEWDRIRCRDRVRPDFRVFTGNDLAIDMVMYGSDYLLGLAAFAPDKFAERDRLWATGDPGFFELNDALQALGSFAFRDPVPAYRAQCAQFLHLRGWIATANTHRRAHQRPKHDIHVLRTYAARLGIEVG